MNTDDIAKAVQAHPSRVRRLVSKLVKSGVLVSNRGSAGGVALAQPPENVTLADVYDAVQEQTILSLGVHDPFQDETNGKGFLRPTFEKLYADLEQKMRKDLQAINLTDILQKCHPSHST